MRGVPDGALCSRWVQLERAQVEAAVARRQRRTSGLPDRLAEALGGATKNGPEAQSLGPS